MNISWKKIIAPLTVFLLYLCNFCANLCTLAKYGHYTRHVKRENPETNEMNINSLYKFSIYFIAWRPFVMIFQHQILS